MTLDEIKEMRNLALEAYKSAIQAHSLSFGGVNNRSVTHQSVKDLKKEFDDWDQRYQKAIGKSKGRQFALATFRRN